MNQDITDNTIPNVLPYSKEELNNIVEEWKDNLSDDGWIELLKKYGHYYHDIGINQDEVVQMWKDEHIRKNKIDKILNE